MGVAYYPVFEQKIAGFDPSVKVSGKPIARAMEQIDKICEKVGVKTLMSFYSESIDEAFAKIGEDVPPGMPSRPIQWSETADGLQTITGVMSYLREHPDESAKMPGILDDLAAFEKVLNKAVEHSTRFRLRIDI